MKLFNRHSLKTKTFLMLLFVVLLCTLPILIYSVKTIQSVSGLGADREVEQALELALQKSSREDETHTAERALMKYRQFTALRGVITQQVVVVSLAYSLVVALLALALGYLFIRKITSPLEKLTEATNRIAHDNLDATLINDADGEMGQLIDAFNKMTRDLKRARELQARAERRAAWQQVARTLAHEIKNPLTPIKLSTERMYDKYLNNKPDFGEVLKSTVDTVLAEIGNLQKLVDSFHQYARLPDAELKVESLDTLLVECTNLYKNENYEILVSIEKDIPALFLDGGQIRQILNNLLKNGVESFEGMRRRGRLDLVLSHGSDGVLLEVRDNGCGMDEEALSKVFQPYFTTKKSGSGIGLALTERMVVQNHGKITVESKKGEGSLFRILFMEGVA